jgi:FtsH-binding integral membrane protein
VDGVYVQPYFPEPVEVPDNVAQGPFRERLTFIKKMHVAYGLSILVVILFCHLVPPFFGPWPTLAAMVASLVMLSVTRNFSGGGKRDAYSSLALMIVFLPALGQTLGFAQRSGFPVWIVWVGLGLAVLYAGVSGRDYSYGGQYVLVALVLLLMTIGLVWFTAMPWFLVAEGLLAFLVYFAFVSYNLSCIMRRRTKDEVVAATADLYRDVLNFITWFGRVYQHWKRFRFI